MSISQRNPMQLAERIMKMKNLNGMKQTDIANHLGLNDSQVSLLVSLYQSHSELKRAVSRGEISISAAEPLLPLTQKEQAELIEDAKGATVREVVALVKAYKQSEITASDMQAIEEASYLQRNLERLSEENLETAEGLRRFLTIFGEVRDTAEEAEDRLASQLVERSE